MIKVSLISLGCAKNLVDSEIMVGHLHQAGMSVIPEAENADVVIVFDTATNDVITRIKAGKRTNGNLVTPDGKRVFATSGGDGTVQAIDPESNTIIAATPIGKRPWNMAITPDGGKLYVACGRSNAVAVVDARTNQKIAEIPVGQLPWGVAIH